MSKYTIRQGKIEGEITIPSSKSHTLRSILFGAMGTGKSIIENYLPSKDAEAMIKAASLLGSVCTVFSSRIEIEGISGVLKYTEDVIDAGNSGIVLRFLTALGALSKNPVVITGDHSIRHQRPMKPLLEGLLQLGVSALSMRGDDFAPIIVQGPLKGGKATIRGEDSQPVSALLIASSFAEGPTKLTVINPGEKPWINLTLHWLDFLKISYEREGFTNYLLKGNSRYQGFTYKVPGDLSSLAFPVAAALVTRSKVLIKNVDLSDPQGDKELIFVLQKMGASIEIDADQKTLLVQGDSPLYGISVDINSFVDAITILAVIACFAEGDTLIYNGHVAREKECNRIHSIATELRKMGAQIEEKEDGLLVKKSSLKGAALNSYNDHRMVMSLSIAAMGASGETTIEGTGCVAKTFPSFVDDFRKMGALIEELP